MRRKLDYVYFPAAISPKICDAIVAYGDGLALAPGDIVNDLGRVVDPRERLDRVARFSSGPDNAWMFDELKRIFVTLNAKHWNFKIERLEALQYSIYDSSGHFVWHRDAMSTYHREISNADDSLLTRKISLTLQLSDPESYTGGYFEVAKDQTGKIEDYEIEDLAEDDPRRRAALAFRPRGSLIVFPSILMHRVTPIRSGVRRSLVAWAIGTPEDLDQAVDATSDVIRARATTTH